MPTAHQQWEPEDFNDDEYEPIETSRTTRIIRTIVGIIGIIAILQFSGLYQYSFFRRTDPQVTQAPIKNVQAQKMITVPLSIYIVKSNSPLNSSRDETNVRDIVNDAQNIWQQAGIQLKIQSIEEIDLSLTDTIPLYAYPRELIKNRPSNSSNGIKVFFTRTLNGLNGIAYGKSNSLTVADFTSNQDFRVLAHEIGHLLGLHHISNTNSLMFKGANGTDMSSEEITTIRIIANNL